MGGVRARLRCGGGKGIACVEPYIRLGVTRGVPLSLRSVVTDNNDRSYHLELGQDASALLVRFAGRATTGWVELAGDIQTPVILSGWYHCCGVGVKTVGEDDS